MTRVLATLVLVATFLLVAPATARTASGDGAAELALLARLNDERVERGLVPLRMADDVRAQARKHSYEMELRRRLAHTANLGRHLCCWRVLGENVAVGGSIASIHAALMRSDAHRAVILDRRFREAGIGVVFDGRRYWVTEDLRG